MSGAGASESAPVEVIGYTRLEVFLIVAILAALGFYLWSVSKLPVSTKVVNYPLPEAGEVLSVQLVTDGKGGLEARCVAGRGRTR